MRFFYLKHSGSKIIGIEGSHVDTEVPADEILQDGWSCLKYIEVDVEGLTDIVIALNDSVVSCALSMLKQSDRWICLCLGR